MPDATNTLTLIERLKVAKTVGGGFDLSPDNVVWVAAALDQLRETRIRRGDAENVLLLKEVEQMHIDHSKKMAKYLKYMVGCGAAVLLCTSTVVAMEIIFHIG